MRSIPELKNRAGNDANGPDVVTLSGGTVRRVGVLTDYFTAPSDEATAATIDWDGGPSRPDVQKRGPRRRGQADHLGQRLYCWLSV